MNLYRNACQSFASQAPLQLIRFCQLGLGLVILWRALSIALPGVWYWDAGERPWLLLACVIYGALGALLAAGRWSGYALLMLCLVHVPFSVAWKAMNLGPQLMQAFIIALLFSGTGVRWLPDLNAARRLHHARWALFLCVAVNHFSAAMFHGDDRYWASGQTIHALTTNLYMFKGAGVVQKLLLWSPDAGVWLMEWFSRIGIVFQLIWQFGMVPMMLSGNRWAMGYAKWYGWFFVVFSFGLNLSVLPLVEVVLWAYLFGPPCLANHRWWSGPFPSPPSSKTSLRPALLLLSGWRWASVFYAVLHVFPGSRTAVSQPGFWDVSRCIGLWAPNVFNETDLRMGDCWVTIQARGPDGSTRMLPLNDRKGRRLWWHLSDILYYGNSLGQRRGVIGRDPFEHFGNPSAGGLPLLRLLQFDRRLHPGESEVVYELNLHRAKASKLELTPEQRFKVSTKPMLKLSVSSNRVVSAEAAQPSLEPLKASLLGRDLTRVFEEPVAP